ncbi:MAG TPA: hypothetical protein PKL76_21265 [Phycisphaerae bacterium]|nr:hypothetical protein [Phycisphaerae bacterium]
MTACLVLCTFVATADAAVTFFVHPDGNLTEADPTRDLAFQAALTLPFTEFDFAQFEHEYLTEPSSLFAGPVRVRPNLLDVNGNNAADLTVNGNRLIELYPHITPDVPEIVEGGAGAGGAAILNRTFSGSGDLVGAAVEFTFSEPVEGFGTWILDDIIEPSQFVLKITESNGATYTSPVLESGNGVNLAVEGFIAVVSDVGVVRVVVEQQTLSGAASNADFFYLDHVQVGRRFPPEICDNGIDDNDDGEVDCDDGECADSPACPEICTDGVDNNGDGLVDCDDPDCKNNANHPECGETFCADGLDNDGDGLSDCSDPDCFGQTGCTVERLCSDGLDNDGDGLVDCADSDCSDDAACPEDCSDGIDNDADGRVDCNDSECSDYSTCVEICDDGVDNDGNGLVDCLDPECSGSASCEEFPTFFVEPDGSYATPDPSRDLEFQAAVGGKFIEFDFSEFGHEYIYEPSTLFAGNVQVRPNLLDVNGNNAADLSVNGDRLIEIYPFFEPFVAGVMEGRVMLNRTYAGNAADVVGAAIEFTFDKPVGGFGAWILDDTHQANRFVLRIVDVNGRTHVSPPMESGNGLNLAIEGFIGVAWRTGIVKAVVEQQTLTGDPSNADFFYLDHVQVVSGPLCHRPFADIDGDKDVDQNDFAVLQRCFTGEGGTVADLCACFDHDGDGDIDLTDVNAFIACGSGPGVLADPTCGL